MRVRSQQFEHRRDAKKEELTEKRVVRSDVDHLVHRREIRMVDFFHDRDFSA